MRRMAIQTYRELRPGPALAPYVTCVWIQEVAPESAPYTHRTVPNGSADVVCAVGSAPVVVGPQTGPVEETLAPGGTVVGVRFRPGAAPAALGVPASELVDLAVETDALWGRNAVGERVAAAASAEAAAAALAEEVLARVAGEPDPVAAEAVVRLLPWRGSDVAALPEALYISERQLRRRCVAAIGVAPKVLHRMLRFQGFLALAARHGRSRADLALLAADTGYADQSHLTRESLRLAGLPPAALLREADVNCGEAHDHSASYGPLLRARAAAA
jgi:AraC-like DNA-binding protein